MDKLFKIMNLKIIEQKENKNMFIRVTYVELNA